MPDRIRLGFIIDRLDTELEAVLAIAWNAPPSPALTDARQSIQAGSRLLEQEIGEDPDGPLLGLLMRAWSLDALGASVAPGGRPAGDFSSRAGKTLDAVRHFRAELDSA